MAVDGSIDSSAAPSDAAPDPSRFRRKDIPMVTNTAAAMVAAAKERIENLAPDQVEREIRQGAMLVDIREPEERQRSGAIPGDIHAVRGMLEFYADPTSAYHRAEFDPRRRLILYCASSGRSALAADMLRSLGYRDVAHLEGGINAWCAAGKPVATG
jgi:rhodanese-related sulfurtransferase